MTETHHPQTNLLAQRESMLRQLDLTPGRRYTFRVNGRIVDAVFLKPVWSGPYLMALKVQSVDSDMLEETLMMRNVDSWEYEHSKP